MAYRRRSKISEDEKEELFAEMATEVEKQIAKDIMKFSESLAKKALDLHTSKRDLPDQIKYAIELAEVQSKELGKTTRTIMIRMGEMFKDWSDKVDEMEEE